MSQIFSHSGAKVLSSYIKKNSLLVESEESVLSINVILQSVICDGLHWRNVDGSSSAWEYHLPMEPFGNIYSYSISNKIYQQLTQHTVRHTPYKERR